MDKARWDEKVHISLASITVRKIPLLQFQVVDMIMVRKLRSADKREAVFQIERRRHSQLSCDCTELWFGQRWSTHRTVTLLAQ